ncbi:Ankyrin repeat domain-containing protein [Plasmodiophora brassicae]
MRIIANVPLLLLLLPLAVILSGTVPAVTLRANDAVGHTVEQATAVAHSGLLYSMIAELGVCDSDITLPNVGGTELRLIVRFMNTSAVHVFAPAAAQWLEDWLSTTTLDAQCRLLVAADYLDVRCLVTQIVWRMLRRGISAIRTMLPANVLWLVLKISPGMVRLGQVARTPEEKAWISEIHDLLVVGDNDASAGSAQCHRYAIDLLQWASSRGEESAVDLLLNVPGIDVNAGDDNQLTAPHWAAATRSVSVVKLLLGLPGINVNARDINGMTPLHWAAACGHTYGVALLLAVPGTDINARDNRMLTALLWAAINGFEETVGLLMNTPRIEALSDDPETTPVRWSQVSRSHNILGLLLNAPRVDTDPRDVLFSATVSNVNVRGNLLLAPLQGTISRLLVLLVLIRALLWVIL